MNIGKSSIEKYLALFLLIFYCSHIFIAQNITPDSFAYIDGAKNLLLNSAYCYDANAQPITLFPPLYAIVLSAVMKFFGTTVMSIALVNTLLFIAAARILWNQRISITSASWKPLLTVWIILHILYQYMGGVLSENLFIPLVLIWLLLQLKFTFTNNYLRLFLLLLIELAMVSTRYTGILLIASFYLADFIAYFLEQKSLKSFFSNGYWMRYLVPVLTLLWFVYLRSVVSRDGEHHVFLLGSGKYSLVSYLLQILKDMGTFFIGSAAMFQIAAKHLAIPVSFFLISLFLCCYRIVMSKKLWLFLAIAAVAHVLFLYSVWVYDDITGRYFFWFYIVILLFARIEPAKRNWKPAIILPWAFIAFITMNDVYFYVKDGMKVSQPAFNGKVNCMDKLQQGYYKTVHEQVPEFKQVNGSRYLVSPYRWNINNP